MILSHVPLICLLLALAIAALQAATLSTWQKRWDAAIRWMLLLPVGISGLWGFLFHWFAPQMAASFIGWAPSPFQFEVAAANLGLGLAGIVGFAMRNQPGYWLAATLMTCSFLWGAAAVHIQQMVKAGNFAPGNAGAIFYTDLLIPLILLAMLISQRLSRHNDRSDAP